jgi:hypothetical protein
VHEVPLASQKTPRSDIAILTRHQFHPRRDAESSAQPKGRINEVFEEPNAEPPEPSDPGDDDGDGDGDPDPESGTLSGEDDPGPNPDPNAEADGEEQVGR